MMTIQESIAQALIELLQTTPLDLISVSLLCKQAHVGRTAYYHYFKNKEDVLKYVYRKAHYNCFKEKFSHSYYLMSDEYLLDMINFFDQNDYLLKALFKWQLIETIAQYNTKIVMEYIRHYQDPLIKENAYYFTCYTGSHYFNMCLAWITQGKQPCKEEFFKLLKYFDQQKRELTSNSL